MANLHPKTDHLRHFGFKFGNPGGPGRPRKLKEDSTVSNERYDEAPEHAVRPNGSAGAIEPQDTEDLDTFDPARWKTSADNRLDPNKKIQPVAARVEVRKPPKDYYVRVNPDARFNAIFPLCSDSAGKRYEPYLIGPDLLLPPQVKTNIVETRLAVTVTDTGRLFLWPVPQTGSEWHESADSLVLRAMNSWIKVTPDGQGYKYESPVAMLPDPIFPQDWEFKDYLSRAFKSRYIGSLDHEVIRRLAGIR